MILVDGASRDGVPVDDRGLAYGDGAFETLRVRGGVAPWLARHHQRLAATCAALGFDAPDRATLAAEIAQVACGADRAVVKVTVTRGSGGRGYAPSPTSTPRRIVVAHPWPAHPATNWSDGVRVRWCATRLASDAPLPGAKHLGRIAQVLARAEWDDPAIAEGLMCDGTGAVVEGTSSNLFALIDGALVTPPITGAGVAGIARGWIMEHASGLGGASERRLLPADVERADELFLCNAVIGVWPVRELAGRRLGIGPIGRHMRDALSAEGCGP